MHGLQTLQKINDAQIAISQARSKTPVADVVEGFFVFEPTGYEISYHTADKLPQDEPAFLTIAFKGDAGNDPRFDVCVAGNSPACNRTLDEAVQIAAAAGVDGRDVAGRLGKQFANISQN